MSVATQTTALFVDAYRELNAKRMFWITLIMSGRSSPRSRSSASPPTGCPSSAPTSVPEPGVLV